MSTYQINNTAHAITRYILVWATHHAIFKGLQITLLPGLQESLTARFHVIIVISVWVFPLMVLNVIIPLPVLMWLHLW